jgi:osmotically-inducible protein OsmY
LPASRICLTPAKEGAESMIDLLHADVLEQAKVLSQTQRHKPARHGDLPRQRELVHVEEARGALSRSNIYDLRMLRVDGDGDSVVLSGRVSSFYHKQLAQEIVRTAADGFEVVNAIRVVYGVDPRALGADQP